MIEPTASPDSSASLSELLSVSCTSAKACMAVGYYALGSLTTVTLVEMWNGAKWVVEPSSNPAGATFSYLAGVSCPQPTACAAAGYYSKGSGTKDTLLEAWNGAHWVIQPSPNPTGTTMSVLSGVSCLRTGGCSAVGSYQNSIGHKAPLAEAWNGAHWVIQPTPDPTGTTMNVLSGVSCSLSDVCMAAGDASKTASAGVTLAEGWNGAHWTVGTTLNPAGQSELLAVSCTSANACTAVGYSTKGAGTAYILVERYT